MNVTTLDVLRAASGHTLIVVTPAFSKDTFVVTCDGEHGTPFYSGIPLVDIFPEHRTALNAVQECWDITERHRGQALLGIARDDAGGAFLGIIQESNVSGFLPGDHLVHTVTGVRYLPLNGAKKCVFEEFQMDGNHYFCDDYDLTRTFPPEKGVVENDEFVWNKEWRRPFAALGLSRCCCALIQGVGISSSFVTKSLTITYLLRRSVRNPGTRYLARGLNENNDPGNEVECELIFVDGERFWTNKWRRGSAAIRWRTDLKSKLSSPSHRVEDDVSRGTLEYFESLKEKLKMESVRVISFLETSEKKSEYEVFQAYQKTLNDLGIPFVAFDINEKLHKSGSLCCHDEFCKMVDPFVEFTEGTTEPGFPCTKKQVGLNRFNCADSLDRVNLATFYYAMYLTKKLRNEISQDIIDFLAKAFVTSGNVVSWLSTNTPAIKVEAFRAFSKEVPPASSDTSISLQRRLQNVAIDPGRNKVIYMFARPPRLNPCVVFDPSHLAIFGKDFPVQLFSTKEITALVGGDHEVKVLLPRDVLLRGISIQNCCANSFMVCGDDSEILGIHNIPETCAKCVYSFTGNKFVRLITIRFFCQAEEFVCGNIAIEGEIWTDPHSTLDLQDTNDVTPEFESAMEEFAASPKQLKDVLQLEKMRINLKISEENAFKLFEKYKLSPYSFNAEARILSAPRTGCAFCSDPLKEVRTRFAQSSGIKSLITQCEEGSLGCCAQCEEFAENIALLEDLYQTQYLTTLRPPPYSTRTTFSMKRDRMELLSSPSMAAFIGLRHRPMFVDGSDPVALKDGEKMELYFVSTTVISNILVFTESKDFSLRFDEWTAERIVRDDCIEFHFSEQPIGTKLTLYAVGDATITSMKIYGVLVVQEHDPPKLAKYKTPQSGPFYMDGEWSQEDRKSTYTFSGQRQIRRIWVHVGDPDIRDLLFCFLLRGQLRGSYEHVRLPVSKPGAKLGYAMGVLPFDSIEVYYCDKLGKVSPHKIGFEFE